MTQLIKALAVIGAMLGMGSYAIAQSGCGGQFGALKFCGSLAGGLAGPVLIPPGGTTTIGGGTVLGNPTTGTALPSATIAPVLGIPGTSVGSISFGNVTSGTVKLQPVTGALGSNILSIPAITDTLAGFSLINGGTNAGLVASNGGILWSNATQLQILAGTATARQMLQSGATATPAWSTTTWPATSTINRILFSSAANTVGEISTVNGGILNANSSGVPAVTVTPVLGVPTASQGTLGFAGVTSGTATVTAQAAAGTPTITLPSASGTLADGASSPLALSATTGNLTCLTCTTSAASLTSNQLVIGSGSQGEQSLGSLGTTTTVLHGNAGGAPSFGAVAIGADVSGLGTGVATALGVNVGTAGAFITNGGALGTPSSGNLTNTTAFPVLQLSGVGANVANALTVAVGSAGAFVANGGALGTPSSGNGANLTGVITTCGSVSTGACAMPYFAASASTSTTVTTSTPTKITMNTKISDSNTWYDAATNFRFTPLLAGRYLVHVQVNCSGTTVSTCVAQIQKNSANYAQYQVNGSAATNPANVSAIVTFNGTTDFVEAFVNNICTGTCQYTGGGPPIQTYFEASFISP